MNQCKGCKVLFYGTYPTLKNLKRMYPKERRGEICNHDEIEYLPTTQEKIIIKATEVLERIENRL